MKKANCQRDEKAKSIEKKYLEIFQKDTDIISVAEEVKETVKDFEKFCKEKGFFATRAQEEYFFGATRRGLKYSIKKAFSEAIDEIFFGKDIFEEEKDDEEQEEEADEEEADEEEADEEEADEEEADEWGLPDNWKRAISTEDVCEEENCQKCRNCDSVDSCILCLHRLC